MNGALKDEVVDEGVLVRARVERAGGLPGGNEDGLS